MPYKDLEKRREASRNSMSRRYGADPEFRERRRRYNRGYFQRPGVKEWHRAYELRRRETIEQRERRELKEFFQGGLDGNLANV